MPDDARECQMMPEGARGCQRGQIGTAVAPALGKASELIFVKVSIAGVEVDALVDTGATMSCCRWGWYQKWKFHLGSLRKSSVRIIGIGNDPIKVKGLSKPLTLQWDGIGGQFQLMVLTALTDVEVVLGMDVLSQFDVKIDFKNQVASPAREPCTPMKPAETVGLLLDYPTFTFKGKIPVKGEEVEEIVKGVPRQGHQEVHRIWTASDRRLTKTADKRKSRRIVRESSMPWDQAGYKAQLQKDLEDIRAKLSRILVQEKVTSGGPLFDLCGQRSEERGSSCNVPLVPDILEDLALTPEQEQQAPIGRVRHFFYYHLGRQRQTKIGLSRVPTKNQSPCVGQNKGLFILKTEKGIINITKLMLSVRK